MREVGEHLHAYPVACLNVGLFDLLDPQVHLQPFFSCLITDKEDDDRNEDG